LPLIHPAGSVFGGSGGEKSQNQVSDDWRSANLGYGVMNMIDDLVELAGLAATDIAIDRTAKKRRWVRVARAVAGLLFLAFIVSVIYVTVKYS
jgi:threonine/homoserine/homoserine lactone efflux protein